ncbi:MAG: cation:proton antiporter [Clostridia bacterium]|nr:cation:proton antiporter [Clostridia bacterium]
MLNSLYQHLDPAAVAIISVAMMLIGGFLMTRLTRLVKLPNVTAYILTGILLGPFVLDVIPNSFMEGSGFLPDIALSFIAFSTGEFFRFRTLKENGGRVLVITLAESAAASVLVFVLTRFVLHLNLPFSIVLSALAAATAPASTLMTIRQTGAKGEYVNTLLQVVALDDLIGLIAYSAAISIATASSEEHVFSAADVLKPVGINLGVLLLGALFGLLMKLFLSRSRSSDNRLIIAVALLFAFCGFCASFDISPLLGCMSMGTVYINLSGDDKLFKQLNYFSPPILLLFFVRSGVSFDLNALIRPTGSVGTVPLVVIGVVYFAARMVGKYGGAFLGCLAVRKDRKVRNFLGLGLVPQAGVAIGLASLGARTLGGDVGNALLTIILASSVLYELIGPALSKLGLYLSGSYPATLEELTDVSETAEDGTRKSGAEILAERIQKIRETNPKIENPAEDAFTEAAEEYAKYYSSDRRPGIRNRNR